MMNKKGQINGVIVFIVAFIALIAVAIPITQGIVNDPTVNLTGMTKTIVAYAPVFLALGGLVLAVGIYQRK